MTGLQSAMFDPGWRETLGIDYHDLQWINTGERLTAESFERYREQCCGGVIVYFTTEELVDAAVTHPLTMIATDGAVTKGKGHPRTAGSHARILSHYVRGTNQLTWMEAIRKMSYMPALRLQSSIPAMGKKGRICIGADADLAIFDPQRIRDTATYENPASPSQGMEFVVINGIVVVEHGKIVENISPGKPIRRGNETHH
jgi:N-acyl-D-aspartate/D-glutamate deacylase